MQNVNPSVYLRFPFNVDDPAFKGKTVFTPEGFLTADFLKHATDNHLP